MSTDFIGTLKVLDVKDNPDGTATIEFDINDEFKDNLVKYLHWEKWSDELFQKFVLEALENAVKNRPVDRIED